MKKIIATLLMITVSAGLYSQTATSVANGNWYMPTTWDCMCIPLSTTAVTVNHDVVLDNDFLLNGGSITVGNNGVLRENAPGRYLVMNSGVITNNGSMQISRVGFYGGSFENNDTCMFYSVFFSGAQAENYGSISQADSLFISAPLDNYGVVSAYRITNSDSLYNNNSFQATEFLNLSWFINDDEAVFTNFLNAGYSENNGEIIFGDLMNTGNFENYNLMSGSDDMTNVGYFYNDVPASMDIANDFSNLDTASHAAYLENEGLWSVGKNFYNRDTIYGTSGLFCIGQTANNAGQMLGSFNFCDLPNSGPPDVNTGHIDLTITFNCLGVCTPGIQNHKPGMVRTNVFPIPATTELYVEVSGMSEPGTLQIFDITGRQAGELSLPGDGVWQYSGKLPETGLYFYRINTPGTNAGGKIVIE